MCKNLLQQLQEGLRIKSHKVSRSDLVRVRVRRMHGWYFSTAQPYEPKKLCIIKNTS